MPTKTSNVSHGRTERFLRRGNVGKSGAGSSSRSLTSIVASRAGSGGGAGDGAGGGSDDAGGGDDREERDTGGDSAISVRATPSISTIALRTSSRISAAFA